MRKITFFILTLIIEIHVFGQVATGLIFLDESQYRNIPLASTATMGTLPTQIDLSNWFPTPGNQGWQSSCVGWAVGYGLKSYQEAVERNQRPNSFSRVYSPSFIYNQIKLNDCASGTTIVSALNFLKVSGVASIASFPYDEHNCHSQPTQSVKNEAKDFVISDWRRINIQDDREVKSQLNAGFPVVIGMWTDEGFANLRNNQIYYGSSGRELGAHAMVVVGYDDSRNAYKILNSWGTNWGTNGFGWISYSAFKNRVKEAYTAQDIVINNPNVNNIVQDNDNRNIDIPPPIPPNARMVSAFLREPEVTHNQMVQTPQGLQPGMIICVPGSIEDGVGSYAQLVLRFFQSNGQPLLANMYELHFRDAIGLVATGTNRAVIVNNPAPVGNHIVSIPYYALNFPPSGGRMQAVVLVQASMYINDFEKYRSGFAKIVFQY